MSYYTTFGAEKDFLPKDYHPIPLRNSLFKR